MLGNFDKGKEADFVALDWNAGQLGDELAPVADRRRRQPETIEQAAQLLFGVMTVGDDRNVDETWIAGRARLQEAGAGRHWGFDRAVYARCPATGRTDRLAGPVNIR